MILTLKSHPWYLLRYISNMESSNANGWKEKVKQRLSKVWIITQLSPVNSHTRVFNLNFRESRTTHTRALIERKKILKCVHSSGSYWALSVLSTFMGHEAILTFASVKEILWCDHSNESYWAVLSCSRVYNTLQGGSFASVDEILWCDHSKSYDKHTWFWSVANARFLGGTLSLSEIL